MPKAFDYFLRYFVGRWKSDREGIIVWPAGRDNFKYTENDHSVLVCAELGSNPSRLIYSSSIQSWLPPHENELLSDEDRKRVIEEICSYLDYYGKTYEVKE